MQNEEFIVVGQLFTWKDSQMRNLSSRNWDQTQSKFSDFKRFALSPRLIRMRWMPVVDRLLIPMEDTVLNVKIQFVQIVRGFL